MATLKELRESRLHKLAEIKKLGIDPFPAISHKDYSNKHILENFDSLEGNEVNVTGRIFSIRGHGKLSFIDIKDASSTLQLVLKEVDIVNADYKYSELNFSDLHLLDTGDFIEATGKVFKTQRGEKSIEVLKIRLLTKSLRPMPDKWDGLKDKETRLRRRYLDTTINQDVFDRFVRRAKFWEATRLFLRERGFLEINVPVLEQIPGGADANPFITHMDAVDQDFFLRISHELQLKRLIGGGYEKVYEIGPRFRNEGLSDEHLPEHMAMEFYWAYASWSEGMEMVKDMFNYIINYVYGEKKIFNIKGYEVDFSKEWEIIDFNNIMKERFGLDIHNCSLKDLEEVFKKEKLPMKDCVNIPRAVDTLWKKIRKTIIGPAFLVNHPKYISPLSKAKIEELHIAERFQPIIAGSELGNGWSENNNPLDQLNSFMEQQKMREAGDNEAQWLDIDYIEMLEYGMPPTFGWGHSERVFWFLEDVTAREGVPFPQLKFELDDSTKEIYPFVSEVYKFKEDKNDFISDNLNILINRDEAHDLLEEHVHDEYQLKHSKMVASVLEKYSEMFGGNKDLWYITGLLHDLDYYEYPEQHPEVAIKWFEEKKFPNELIHAVKAHAFSKTGEEPKTKLAACLLATDELCGFVWAYSLMRPNGLDGMEASSVLKKFKDKTFAAKIDREEISRGVEFFQVDMKEHIELIISVLKEFKKW